MFNPAFMNWNIAEFSANLLSTQGLECQYVMERYKVSYLNKLKENLSIAFARSVKHNLFYLVVEMTVLKR